MRVDLLPVDGSGLFTQLSSFRVEIDPTSNPSPQGGLLVPAPSNTQFNIPLLTSNGPGFQLCEAYVDDPANDYDFSQISSGIVKFNRSGYFELGFNIYIISQAIETDGTIAMILKNGQAIFGSPPSCSNTRTSSDTYSSLPGLYVKNLNANANTKISAGDEIVLAIITNNVTPGNDISIQACTNLFCTRLSSNSVLGSGSGSVYDSNLENTGAGTQILANPGVFPSTVQRNFKSLLAGTNVSFVDSGTDITINASSSVPNSDLQNLGGGNAILNTTGVLPVTNTRNFKTLLAGTAVTISSAANTLTFNAQNIYNTSGALTGLRVLDLNGSDLIINGTGNLDFSINSGFDGDTQLGCTAKDIILYGNVQMPDIPSATNTNILMYNTVSNAVTYQALTSVTFALFSVCLSTNAFSVAGPYSTIQFPTTLGYTYATTNASNFQGYNSAGVLLNTGTGVFSPSQSTNYNISAKITIKNDTEIPNIELQFYDATSALLRSRALYYSGEINQYNTYSLNENVAMSAGRNYVFRLIINNGAGTTTSFQDCIFSINKI